VRATDGYELAADLYLPDGGVRAAVLVAPAMGVPRRLYGAFSAYLAEAGLAFAYGLYAAFAALSLWFVWIAARETRGIELEDMRE
jgi:predicted alpha/beta hydrolase